MGRARLEKDSSYFEIIKLFMKSSNFFFNLHFVLNEISVSNYCAIRTRVKLSRLYFSLVDIKNNFQTEPIFLKNHRDSTEFFLKN